MIDSFQHQYRFLSNFYVHPIMIDGLRFGTNEHAYQAHKSLNSEVRLIFTVIRKAGDAKAAGQVITMRPDWEEVKVPFMRFINKIKFSDPKLAARLVATGQQELVEGNKWKDTFWGVCGGKGENRLGIILMDIRKQLATSPNQPLIDPSQTIAMLA